METYKYIAGQKVLFEDKDYGIAEVAEVLDVYIDGTVQVVKLKLSQDDFRILRADSSQISRLVVN